MRWMGSDEVAGAVGASAGTLRLQPTHRAVTHLQVDVSRAGLDEANGRFVRTVRVSDTQRTLRTARSDAAQRPRSGRAPPVAA